MASPPHLGSFGMSGTRPPSTFLNVLCTLVLLASVEPGPWARLETSVGMLGVYQGVADAILVFRVSLL